jgi:hypothetical protein
LVIKEKHVPESLSAKRGPLPGTGRLLMLAWAALMLVAGPALARAAVKHHIYLTREAAKGQPDEQAAKQFDCSDKIYAVMRFYGLKRGAHEVVAHWYNARGRLQEKTPYSFSASAQDTRIWLWLQLHRPSANMWDRILLQDRAAGMEDFVGEWKVKFYLDGKHLDTRKFLVFC